MSPERLDILFVSQMPASPPRFGAQARMHGLMTQLARRHDLTAVMLVDDEFDIEECRRAMQAYCREVVLVPNPYGREDLTKRLLQVRSLASTRSFERLRVTVPALQQALNGSCAPGGSTSSTWSSPSLATAICARLRPARGSRPWSWTRTTSTTTWPGSTPAPAAAWVVGSTPGPTGASCGGRSWGPTGDADGVYLCSAADEQRLLDQVPGARTAVIPNAADVEYYQPRPTDPPPDGRTVVFFGLLSYVPNIDGVIHFVQDIWPRIAEAHPDARCKIIGGRAPPSLLALAGPRVELTGFVPDLRPHLAEAAAVVVPLRLGGGTRLKIVEAMAMGKAIVSTTLGAEGIEAVPGRELLIEDRPGGLRGRGEPFAGRARPGNAHRPVGEAAGGGAILLERCGPGAGGLLSPHPRDEKPARLRGAGFADANAPRPARALTSQSASGGPSQLAVRLPKSAQDG